MGMPTEYEGREQSYLKHRVLEQYLTAWAQKLGSLARFKDVKLVYVDCFAGPWQSGDKDLRDTSVFIGLNALSTAVATWKGGVKPRAVFVERDADAFGRLQSYLATRPADIETVAIHGEFGSSIDRINREIGDGAAFLFIDPTGWTGVAMRFIAPLARVKQRDVMINVMFNDVNRFKDDGREFLRRQMREFFGLTDADIPAGLDEDELLAFYRDQLKQTCALPYVANLAIPHPMHNRTWFHLVVGGHHHEVLNLFRNVERKVCGSEADEVRSGARTRAGGQAEMIFGQDPAFDARHERDLRRAGELLARRQAGRQESFLALWTEVLSAYHVTRADVVELTLNLLAQKRLTISPPAKRSISDDAQLLWT
ncbi:MAG: three-Cys-motif partner protein TcmP [Myxococcota bacterium]